MSELRLAAAADPGLDPWHLSVDGMSEQGPNLSHWPGNRTPPQFKADLSTGICLRFARAADSARAGFLAGATQVLNTHYDTDGFLSSLLAVLRPSVAIAREEVCLAAAATGDFGSFVTRRAFAIDRIVLNLGTRAGGPMYGQIASLARAERDYARYRWLLEHAERVLDEPETLAPLYAPELDDMLVQLERAHAGALRRTLWHREGLAVLESDADFPRMVLNTFGVLFTLLHVRRQGRGRFCYRLHDRTESWFEMVTVHPPARTDLRPLAARLQALEPAGGAARWNADAPDEPIPELYFGVPSAQEYGQVTRALGASALPPERVVDEIRAHLAQARAPSA